MANENQKVFITGIEGFTGVYLKRYLELKNYDVYGTSLISEDIENSIFHCDLLDAEKLNNIINEISPDFVIHLAGISSTSPETIHDVYSVNVLGTLNLLDSCLQLDSKPENIILASTALVYGNKNEEELNENMCPAPNTHYGNSKLAMENMARNYFDKLNIMIVRPFNYTGPGHSQNFVIPKIIAKIKEGKNEIELGNVDVLREFNDIHFITELYYKIMVSKHPGATVNLCSGRAVSIKEIIGKLSGIIKRDIKIKVNDEFIRNNEIPRLTGSIEKLQSIIGEMPKMISIETTLTSMLNNS